MTPAINWGFIADKEAVTDVFSRERILLGQFES